MRSTNVPGSFSPLTLAPTSQLIELGTALDIVVTALGAEGELFGDVMVTRVTPTLIEAAAESGREELVVTLDRPRPFGAWKMVECVSYGESWGWV